MGLRYAWGLFHICSHFAPISQCGDLVLHLQHTLYTLTLEGCGVALSTNYFIESSGWLGIWFVGWARALAADLGPFCILFKINTPRDYLFFPVVTKPAPRDYFYFSHWTKLRPETTFWGGNFQNGAQRLLFFRFGKPGFGKDYFLAPTVFKILFFDSFLTTF